MPAFQIRLSDEEMDALRERAGETSLAAYVRSVLFGDPAEHFDPELEKWIAWRSEVKGMTRHVYLEQLLKQLRREFERQEADPDLKARVRAANTARPNGVVPAADLPKIAPRR